MSRDALSPKRPAAAVRPEATIGGQRRRVRAGQEQPISTNCGYYYENQSLHEEKVKPTYTEAAPNT